MPNLPSPITALLCLLMGAVVPLSLAPFNVWFIAPLSLAFLILALKNSTPRTALVVSFVFGLGMFGTGISWVYISIHEYGYAPIPLALLLTILFAGFLAFVFALPLYVYAKYFNSNALTALFAFPALWVLGEWFRSWFLTGFPWLYLGYGHLETPLAGWLPVAGVYSVSWIIAFTAAALVHCYVSKKYYSLIGVAVFFVLGFFLQQIEWTGFNKQAPITVGVVQPNFSLHEKWNPEHRMHIRETMANMSEPLWTSDMVLWPEAALSEFYQQAQPFLQNIHETALKNNSALITGIPYYNETLSTVDHPVYHNSILAIGNGEGLYHKVRLVPFGEYVPLETWLRGLIQFFDLPMSEFSKGEEDQSLLKINHLLVAPFICYEIVYPSLVAKNAKNSAFLVTISNDSWFGGSIGPLQHLQMAQVRAVETGRYLIRGTNDGISAIIDPKGKLLTVSKRFTAQTLRGEVYAASGETLFMYTGSLPLIALFIIILISLKK